MIEPIWADGDRDLLGSDQKGRTQRQTMALKDVRYRLYGHLRFHGNVSEAATYDAQFERRAAQGKCFYQPYLGCREFPAYFELLDGEIQHPRPYAFDLDLGWMLYDVFDLHRANESTAPARVSLFQARVINGVMLIPPFDDPAVRKVEEAPHA